MELLEAMKARRSIRKYVADAVPEDLVEQVLEAARRAPSGGNGQPWRFVVARDAEVRRGISNILSKQKFFVEAPVNIVCFAVMDRYSPKGLANEWQQLSEEGIAQTLSGDLAKKEFWDAISSLPAPPREVMIREPVANCYIAIEHLLLMAAALGLGTCWCGATDRPQFNKLFDLPDSLVSVAATPLGYPAGKIPPIRPRLSLDEIVLKAKGSSPR